MRTIWLRHSFEARGRARGRPTTTHGLGETHAFGVPEADPSDAPVVMSVNRRAPNVGLAGPGRALPGDRRQVLTYRLLDGVLMRSMLGSDDATPLEAASLTDARAALGGGMGAWHDNPAFWADAKWPGQGTPPSNLVEVDEADLARARSTMARNVASLRCIDGTLWAPSPPPAWSLNGRGEVTLLVPGLDLPRVRDLAAFSGDGGILDRRFDAGPLVPWHVPFDVATRILGAAAAGQPHAETTLDGDDDLQDCGLDAFRAHMLASDIDVRLGLAEWGRLDPAARAILATVSASCRAAVSGDPSPHDAMDEAAHLLSRLPEMATRKGWGGKWPALDDVVASAAAWTAAHRAEGELAPLRALRDNEGMASFSP